MKKTETESQQVSNQANGGGPPRLQTARHVDAVADRRLFGFGTGLQVCKTIWFSVISVV